MNVKAIKTIRGKAPLTEYNDVLVSNDIDREHSLINIFPDIE